MNIITKKRLKSRILILLLAVCASAQLLAAPLPPGVTVVEEAPGRLVLDVRVPDPVTGTDLPGGIYLHLPGYGVTWEEGRAILPRSRVRIAVPDGADVQVATEILEERTHVGFDLAARPRVKHGVNLDNPALAGETTLQPDGPARGPFPYPAALARVTDRGRLRELPVAAVELNPVQMLDPNRLRVARRFRVTLTWEEKPAARSLAPASADEPFSSAYRSMVANPEASSRLRAGLQPLAGNAGATGAGEAAMAGPVSRPAVPLTPVAGSLTYRLGLSTTGVHRLDVAWITANAPDILNHNANRIFLAGDGNELPIRVVTGNPALPLSGADYIEFYGEMVDGDPLDPDVWDAGDFTDERPYYLGVATGPRLRMSTAIAGNPVSGHPLATTFTETLRPEENDTFFNTVPSDGAERWYDAPFLLNSTPTRDVQVSLPGLSPSGTAEVKVRLLGLQISGNLNGLHRTRINVNGNQVDQADWDGVVIYTHGEDAGVVSFNANLLTPTTTVQVELPLDRLDGMGMPLTNDLAALDWVEMTYPRTFDAVGDRLTFTIPNQSTRVRVDGLTSADAAVYDVTDTTGGLAAPHWLQLAACEDSLAAPCIGGGPGPFSLTFEIDPTDAGMAGATDRVLSISAGAALQPDSVEVHDGTANLLFGGADWVVIGHESLVDLTPGSELSNLVTLRESQGLSTAVFTTRQVYDQFTYGLEEPQAIRDFIHWMLVNWSPAPSFVVLLGDGTFDFKNDYGHAANRNLLPTFMVSQIASPILTYFSEDNRFAAVIGADELADVHLGRIPAHSLAEAEGALAKIIAYDSLGSGAPWTRRGFFISDEESGGFEFAMRQVIDRYFDLPTNPGVLDPVGPCFPSGTCRNNQTGQGPIFDTASFQTLIDRNPMDLPITHVPTINQWIDDGVNAGAAVTYYIGHGGFQNWGRNGNDLFQAESFDPDDLDDLTNSTTPTFVVNINCITGGFHADTPASVPPSADLLYSLAEDLVLKPDGGAIGILAPSHLTFISILSNATNATWDSLLGEDRVRRLGDLNLVVRQKFDEVGSTTDVRSFAFLADPATILVMPDPKPPLFPDAQPGNSFVDLSWVPSVDAVSYRVERSANGPAGPYQDVPMPDPTATAFQDTTVSNSTTYHYKIFAVDVNGMRSAPSNRNLDCPGGGGCLEATPVNLVPPQAPAGFTLVDTKGGGELQLDWLTNPEPDIDFYRARWGTTSGVLSNAVQFASFRQQAQINGFANDVPIFMTLEAVNTSGVVGPPTAELTATPRLILGVNPPKDIFDLDLSLAGGDVRLNWSQITEDIYGDPTTVQEYRIFHSAVSPNFAIEAGNLLGTAPDSASPQYDHAGAGSGPEARFYIVLSRDTGGLDSAAGDGTPAPVYDLQVERLGGGMLRLSWSPISVDYLGEPMFVHHYQVYASGAPIPRASIDGLTPVAPLAMSTTLDVPESAGEFFSVIVVGRRGTLSPY